MEQTKIRCRLMSGNFDEVVSVDDFVAAFRAGIENLYPDSDVEIEVENASGSGSYYLVDNEPSSELQWLSESVWEELIAATNKCGFFCLGNTARGFWIGWEGYSGEEFDPQKETENEYTWLEFAESKHLDKFWDAYAGESITEQGLNELSDWLRDSNAPTKIVERVVDRLREDMSPCLSA